MKKFMLMVFSVILALGAVGCGGAPSESDRVDQLKAKQQEGRGMSKGDKELLLEAQEEQANQEGEGGGEEQ
ncbi:MAG: hypothetical protein IT365_05270 [Candidatus Hydrogenedentes bacterium]|nr:hypothetical protein [Candidatus Hydrogenedentota bacterium]